MIKLKKNKLGSPKKLGGPKITNLEKPQANKEKQLVFSVTPEFHKEYKNYATNQGKTMTKVLKDSFKLYKEKNI